MDCGRTQRLTSCRRSSDGDGVKPFHGEDSRQGEEDQHYALRDSEGRFGTLGGKGVQRRYFQEGLHDEDEDVKVKGDNGANDVDPAPTAAEMEGMAGRDRRREHD